jgi:hypothetical protein
MRPNVHGTFSEGLTMIVFPVARAIGIVQNGTYVTSSLTERHTMTGKLKGTIEATTPNGTLSS